MSGEPIDPRLAGLAPPEPPGRLRARTLEAAASAWGARPDVWQRLWESRPLRLAWAAAVATLALCHLWISGSERPAPPPSTLAGAVAPRDPLEREGVTDVLEIRIAPIAWLGEGFSRAATAQPRRATDREKESS